MSSIINMRKITTPDLIKMGDFWFAINMTFTFSICLHNFDHGAQLRKGRNKKKTICPIMYK